MAIHPVLVAASHAQSRVVVTLSEPVAPSAGTMPVIEFATDTWHFRPEGALTSIEVDPQAAANSETTHATNSRARIARLVSAIALPGCAS